MQDMKRQAASVSWHSYEGLLATRSARQWERLGAVRRAGVAVPLFSIYSKKSVGVGEIPDLRLLVDWCVARGMSVIQLLPMNDVGSSFRPYDAESSFALDPMYLALGGIGTGATPLGHELAALARRFPAGGRARAKIARVDYAVKGAKLEFLWHAFQLQGKQAGSAFERFRRSAAYWLKDYALFRVMKEHQGGRAWFDWPEPLARRDPHALVAFERKYARSVRFQVWLQWQLYEQLRAVRAYAAKKGALLMGDLPFLVSRDSADVWAHQDYFKLDFASGAPPDTYQAKGQRWGMPPYDWPRIAAHGYDYVKQKLSYAQNFYDLFRIDHVVGAFRLWTIPRDDPPENAGLHGSFDPPEESRWEEHGRAILSAMVDASPMLACAEDLGVIPACTHRVLAEFGIPGMEVQRWARDWGDTYAFKSPEAYRPCSAAVISTHDTSSFRGWWDHEAGTVDEGHLRRTCEAKGIAPESVRIKFFDLRRSRHGRLRWRQGLTEDDLLAALGRNAQEAREILDLYRATFGERETFWASLALPGKMPERATPALARAALRAASASASIFAIQLLTDYLSLSDAFTPDAWAFRINFPGVTSPDNWSLVMPVALEDMAALAVNRAIRDIYQETERI